MWWRTTRRLLALTLCALIANATPEHGYNLSVTAETLIKAFYENEVAANAKYAGAAVSVGGAVHRVGTDDVGNPYVILNATPSQGMTSSLVGHVRCNFSDAYNAQIAKLRTNTLIAVHGTVVGAKSQGRETVLKDCSL